MHCEELQEETEQLDGKIGRLNSKLLKHSDPYREKQPYLDMHTNEF